MFLPDYLPLAQIFATAAPVLSPYAMENSLSIELQDLPSESRANSTSVSNIVATGGQAGLENEEVSERVDVTCFMQPAAQWWVRFGDFHEPPATCRGLCCRCFQDCFTWFLPIFYAFLGVWSMNLVIDCYRLDMRGVLSKDLSLLSLFLVCWPGVDCAVHIRYLDWERGGLKFDSARLFSQRQHGLREPVALRRNSFYLGIAFLVSTLTLWHSGTVRAKTKPALLVSWGSGCCSSPSSYSLTSAQSSCWSWKCVSLLWG